ncbi:WhiB family transcriptional regulator [Streptomyces syringium]|uniref:WhiB family transcriptional regulator n=1 Tax=Streptomyces syringium TaxID=76729 RepID=UPI0033C325FB
MKIRLDIAELLSQGLPDYAIAKTLRVDRTTVIWTREQLGLPKSRAGRKAASSIEELFYQRVEHLDDGHLRWTGYRCKQGVPKLRYEGRTSTAYRVAFRIHHGRDPEGRCAPACELKGCVAPGHVDDDSTRQRDRRAYADIVGRRARKDRCIRGHDLKRHRYYFANGRSCCGACVKERSRAADGTGPWQNRALCQPGALPGVSPELWYAEKKDTSNRTLAKSLCAACKALDQCREDTLAVEGRASATNRYGIRAGMTEHERYTMAKRRAEQAELQDQQAA